MFDEYPQYYKQFTHSSIITGQQIHGQKVELHQKDWVNIYLFKRNKINKNQDGSKKKKFK